MAKRKKTEPEHDQPQPQLPPEQEKAIALAKLKIVYEEHLNDEMANLHNRFVAFISESRLPLPQALMVIKMLEAEIMDQARLKYMGS